MKRTIDLDAYTDIELWPGRRLWLRNERTEEEEVLLLPASFRYWQSGAGERMHGNLFCGSTRMAVNLTGRGTPNIAKAVFLSLKLQTMPNDGFTRLRKED